MSAYGYLTPSTGFTFQCWFNRNAGVGSVYYPAFCSQFTQAPVAWSGNKSVNGKQFWFGLAPTTGAMGMSIYQEGGTSNWSWFDPSPSGYPSDGSWHRAAITTPNGLTWRIWLDDARIASGNATFTAAWRPGSLTVGGGFAPYLGNYGSELWDKKLALVSAYNRELSDAEMLASFNSVGSACFSNDNEVDRLNRIYGWTATPAWIEDHDPPLSVLRGASITGANALTSALDAAKGAGGMVFADGQGYMQYHNRRHSYNRWSLFDFCERLGAGVGAGLDFTTDVSKIYNDVKGTLQDAGTFRLSDNVSIESNGRKTYSFTLPVGDSEEMRNTVGWILSRYGDALLRVSSITLSAATSDVLQAATSGLVEIGDRFTVTELPNWCPQRELDLTVEGISLDADFAAGTWNMTFNTSPAKFGRVIQLGVSVLGDDDKVAL